MGQTADKRPEVATRHVLATTTGTLYSAGGAAALLAASDDPARSAVLAVAAVVALGTGLAVLRWGSVIPYRLMHVMVACGSLLCGVAVASAPDPLTACVLSSLFTFAAIDCYYYFARRPALLQLLFLLVVASTVVLWRGVPVSVTAALLVVLAAVAVVVSGLVNRASAASRDPLTGLLNRRGTDDALDEAVTTAQRNDTLLTVVLLDVDRFKAVNDTQGHASGDALLRGIAQDLRRALPPSAVLGRPGGDEFVALLPHLDDEAALAVVQEAHRAVRHPLSVGLVGYLPAESTGTVLHRADAALYAAKQNGRNCVVRGDATTSHLSRDLAAALAAPAGGALDVVLQPVVRSGSAEVVAVEALVRWEHPVRGCVPADDVVAAAAGAGLSAELGAFVLGRACAGAAALRGPWGDDLDLHVNLAAAELTDAGRAEEVLDVLHGTGWPADRLVVEVGEDVVDAGAGALACLGGLRSQGVRIAVDYGAGRSTLAHLDDVPADVVKLDQSLVVAATTSARRRALLQAVLDVAQTLHLVAVAEGVETLEQAELVTALGCPLSQGHFYARPAPVDELLQAGVRHAEAAIRARTPGAV